jgi:hypothetical protein
MPTSTVEAGTNFEPDERPATVLFLNPFDEPMDALNDPGVLGDRQTIEKELDLIAAAIRVFWRKQPDQVLRECSAYSARLTELAVLLHRVEAGNRQYTRIRTQQVERFLAEIDRQWKTASRLVEVMRQDIDLSR